MIEATWIKSGRTIKATYTPKRWVWLKTEITAHGDSVVSEVEITPAIAYLKHMAKVSA